MIDEDGDFVCSHCGRDSEWAGQNLHTHHIKARQDGGTDDPENLDYLCHACHREWHIVEDTTNLTYVEWLRTPTVGRTSIFFSVIYPQIKHAIWDGKIEYQGLESAIELLWLPQTGAVNVHD